VQLVSGEGRPVAAMLLLAGAVAFVVAAAARRIVAALTCNRFDFRSNFALDFSPAAPPTSLLPGAFGQVAPASQFGTLVSARSSHKKGKMFFFENYLRVKRLAEQSPRVFLKSSILNLILSLAAIINLLIY
jgi:hypothetical protein